MLVFRYFCVSKKEKTNVMKKNYMKSFTFLVLLLAFGNSIFSQSMSKEQFDSLSKENKELYTRLVNEFSEREAKIKSYLLASTINRRY